jgi:ABC-2 type transport system ATP-binding protein
MLDIRNISKSYNGRDALRNVSLRIERGEIFGLLGPNGAGKTTLMSILSTLLQPTSGTASVCGFDVGTQAGDVRKLLGCVPQEISLYDDLSAYDNLMFFGSMYGVARKTLKERVDAALETVGLQDRARDRVATYSGGMKRRANMAVALLHEPKAILLDEPTVGIDPQSRLLLLDVVASLARDDRTVVYTTHYMEEAERLCDRVAIIDEGRIVAVGSNDELIDSIGQYDLVDIEPEKITEAVLDQCRGRFGPDNVSRHESLLRIRAKDARKALPQMLATLSEIGVAVSSVNIRRPNLETVFLALTGKELRD